MSGLIFTFIVGLFFLLLSFLVKANPHLIAGSESMMDASEDSKLLMVKNISDAFLIGGIAILCIGIGVMLLKKDIPIVTTLLISILVPAYIFVKNRTLLKPASKTLLVIVFASILIISGLLIYSDRTPEVIITATELSISGLHGEHIELKEIKDVKLLKSIPKIKLRSNGYSRGNIKKGYFKLQYWGICKLFLETDKAPYILIHLRDDQRIILNFKDEVLANKHYNQLKTIL